ncbi:MAG: DUF362 domain-containing protein [candidate division KSB1 bacterium]|nr:DUF362 domain-containing protein [candidate division KSB1 bacterium]
MDRRAFLRSLAVGPFLVGLSPKGRVQARPPLRAERGGKSVVAQARDPSVWRDGQLVEGKVGELLDRAVAAAFGYRDPAEVWKQLVARGDRVGIKVNCLSGRRMSTNLPLVWAIIERLRGAGISANDIVVWDRLDADLEKAGYPVRRRGQGPRFCGNDSVGYYEGLFAVGEIGSLVSNVAVRDCDVLINVPVLKDHGIVGVTLALKNYFGAIHNPNKYHARCGDPYIADVNLIPALRQKTRLIICDALEAQCEGGPPFMPQWAWRYSALLVATDPVALDYVGWQIIETRRKEVGLPTLREAGREPTYILTAADAQHRLGVADMAKIEVVEG